MSGGTPGNRPRPGQSDVYWRRRAIVLAAAIGVLVLIAWTVNGALGGGGSARQAADSTHTGQHGHHVLAAAAATSPARSSGAASSPGAATPTPGPTAQGKHGQAKHGQGKHSQAKHGQHHAAAGPGSATTCPAGSVVLSLFMPKYRFQAHQAPRFEVDVVSTAARPCSFDMGMKNVQLVIKVGGERQVWDSADCVRSAGHRMDRLVRGVPAVLSVSWDRKASAAGCRLGQAAPPGTYTATAHSGPLHSQSLIFVLAGPGIAVP